MRRLWILPIFLVALLTGCEWMNGLSVSISPHEESYVQTGAQKMTAASDYDQLYTLMLRMVQSNTTTAAVDVSEYQQEENLGRDLNRVVKELFRKDPLTAYAVDNIETTQAEVGVRNMVNITIHYSKTVSQIHSIESVWGTEGIKSKIEQAMKEAKSKITLRVNAYEPIPLEEVVQNCYDNNMAAVMEKPEVTAEVYPIRGPIRIMEINFQYSHDQRSLLSMAQEVKVMIFSAEGYVRGQETDRARVERLNSFLQPLVSEEGETSTPVYSLLYEGVGDSHSVAVVFKLLCREAGLQCHVVTGQYGGVPYSWNIVKVDGSCYHVDLPRCWKEGHLELRYDDEMTDYQWQSDEYPLCLRPVPPPEQTEDGESQATERSPDVTKPQEPTEFTEVRETSGADSSAQETEGENS